MAMFGPKNDEGYYSGPPLGLAVAVLDFNRTYRIGNKYIILKSLPNDKIAVEITEVTPE